MDAKIFCKLGITSEECIEPKTRKFSGAPTKTLPKKGDCCCNCIHQKPINAHPSNKGKTKGKVSKTIGFGCAIPEIQPFIIFLDHPHGICSSYERTVENDEKCQEKT